MSLSNQIPGAPTRHQADYEPWILEHGEHVGEVSWLRREPAAPREIRAGLFRLTDATFDGIPVPYDFVCDETIYVVEGGVRIELETGEIYELASGDTASFPRSTKSTWTFHIPFMKFFVEN
jgi:uncharacterized cupin superfamily protein